MQKKQNIVNIKVPQLASLNMRIAKLENINNIINNSAKELNETKTDNIEYKQYLKAKIAVYNDLKFRVERIIKVDEKIVNQFLKTLKNKKIEVRNKKVGVKNAKKRS